MNINKLSEQFEKRILKELKPHTGKVVALSGGIDSGTLAALCKPSFAVSVELPGGDRFDEIKYSKKVAKHLKIQHLIIKPNPKDFDKYMKEAVKAIGRPIPHFNIFPLFCMYKALSEMGIKELILGDGPDETLSGYTRNLIMNYIYNVYNIEAFKNYHPTIDKILPEKFVSDYSNIINKDYDEVSKIMKGKKIIQAMNKVDMILMRKDMDDMSNKIAKHFGIKNIRPYQDNVAFDNWQYNLPDEAKIFNVEYGKYILRMIAEKYLPGDIAWRKHKVGGPVYPVNKLKKWDKKDGDFGKESYLEYQKNILK